MPFISPYNVNSILNPLLVQVMALGYFYNMYRGKPLLKKGGVMILTHPCSDEFDPVHHPSYIEFFNRLLPETRDAMKLRQQVRGRVRAATRATSRCTGAATRTTARTRSSCGTGARTAASTSAR